MLPRVLYRAEKVRALDAAAIAAGTPGLELMERAARAAFRYSRTAWPKAKNLHIVCGGGNNAGDGYAFARLAFEARLSVRVFAVGSTDALGPDARAMYDRLRTLAIPVERFDASELSRADLIVDALLGTGLSRSVAGSWAEAVNGMNEANAPVLALDIPSGLDSDTGAVRGTAVSAAATVTFIGMKLGLLTGAGPDHIGRIVFEALGVEAPRDDITPDATRIDHFDLFELAPRQRTGHKGTHGHVLVVGGDEGFSGAARLAGEAAARAGAGLTSIATRASHAPFLNLSVPELMVHATETEAALNQAGARANAVAVGPGLGQGPWGKAMLAGALALERPTVVDADGLNLLAKAPRQSDNWILTPHPAEAGRLLDAATKAVQSNRFAAAQAIAKKYGGVCVLKGAGTIVGSAGGHTYVCSAGNPGLGTGGSGDVLTGIIVSFLAQGLTLVAAARLGVCAHAHAGDLAAVNGERGMLASDVINTLREAVNPV